MEVAWRATELEWRHSGGYSYSKLARFWREGPQSLLTRQVVDNEGVRFGSLFDCLLTDRNSLNSRFLICDYKKPSQKLIDIAKFLLENHKDTTTISEISDTDILIAVNIFDYRPTNADKLRISKAREALSEYYRILTISGSKTVVSSKDLEDAEKCVEALYHHPYTKGIFNRTVDERLLGEIEILYQVHLKTLWEDKLIKGILDIIRVDHKNKRIYPYDVKTSGKPKEKFESSFLSFNYYLQANMYTHIIKSIIEKDDYFKDFTVADFEFLVINRYDKRPIRWVWSPQHFNTAQAIRLLGLTGIKTWQGLIRDIEWHIETGEYNYPADAGRNCGRIQINPLSGLFNTKSIVETQTT